MGLELGLEPGQQGKARVRARVRGWHGWAREAEHRPRRTDVAPGASEAALVGGVARPLQADHEAGAKGSGASFELGGGRGGCHIAVRGKEEHGCAVVLLVAVVVIRSRCSLVRYRLYRGRAGRATESVIRTAHEKARREFHVIISITLLDQSRRTE